MKISSPLALALCALFSIPAFAQPARTSPLLKSNGKAPKVLLGVDAQAPSQFDKVVSVGANCLIRYDRGPQKNISMETWIAEARKRDLYYIIQGTAGIPKLPDDHLLAIAQDDEPDLNRFRPGQDNSLYVEEGRFKGWTKPEILEQRYADWKKAAPNIPIIVNFAGQHISSPWYVDGSGHKPYIKASDWRSFDWYPRNTNADRYRINFIGLTIDKLASWDGAPVFAYIECSDQLLDKNQKERLGRGPTPEEISDEIWHALAHGAKGVWLFPQQILGGFKYWAVTPEGEVAIKEAFATIKKYDSLIADGKRELKEEFPTDAKGGKWPTWEEVTWTAGGQKLTVHIDLNGETAPKVTFAGK